MDRSRVRFQVVQQVEHLVTERDVELTPPVGHGARRLELQRTRAGQSPTRPRSRRRPGRTRTPRRSRGRRRAGAGNRPGCSRRRGHAAPARPTSIVSSIASQMNPCSSCIASSCSALRQYVISAPTRRGCGGRVALRAGCRALRAAGRRRRLPRRPRASGDSPDRSTAHATTTSPKPSRSCAACSNATNSSPSAPDSSVAQSSRALALDALRLLPQRPLDAAHEIEDVVHTLRLGLRVANERGPQAPVVGARPLREIDQTRELRRLDLGGHRLSVRVRSWARLRAWLLPIS